MRTVFVGILIWLALGLAALAQPQCPLTPAVGTNNSLCASTAFVNKQGFVTGPGSSTDGDFALFSGSTGKILKDGPPSSVLATFMQGYIGGLTLSNDAGTPNTIIDIAKGVAASDDVTALMKLGAFTKTIGGTWVSGTGNAGLDVGAVLASTWYHVYEIGGSGQTNDILLSQCGPSLSGVSVTATNANPAVFTYNSGQALPFQNGAPIILGGTTAPTNFVLGTVYFVVAENQAAGTFELAATQGGSAKASASTGTAVTASCNPQLPASYTLKRRIGSLKTDGSSHILGFTQDGDYVRWKASVRDVSTANPGSSSITAILPSVPIGVNVQAIFNIGVASGAGTNDAYVSDLAANDEAVTPLNVPGSSVAGVSAQFNGVAQMQIRVNTAQQLRYRQTGSNASDSYSIMTLGYNDGRGRFN